MKTYTKNIIIWVCILFLGTACSKNEDETQGKVPEVSTAPLTSISQYTAVSGGNVNLEGSSEVSVKGICWSKQSSPTTANTKTNDGSSSGSFESKLTNLEPNTLYYVRAYATNSAGTGYGNTLSFTTLPAPVLSTLDVSSIELHSAFSGGSVLSDGGSSIIERGVCWSETAIPDISNIRTLNGQGTGSFTSKLTSLKPNTTYYVRAYAKNLTSIGYGNTISFTTKVQDIDGNVYGTVNIGSQVWMTENLRVTKYSNGDEIAKVADPSAWSSQQIGAYCEYSNSASMSNTYAYLYNFNAVNDVRNIAPTGWHVATDEDWKKLSEYLGDASNAGGKLKESGTTNWSAPNTSGSNESGFTALPGGYRYGNGSFLGIGLQAYFWSKTENGTLQAWHRILNYNSADIVRSSSTKNYGMSVRCVRN